MKKKEKSLWRKSHLCDVLWNINILGGIVCGLVIGIMSGWYCEKYFTSFFWSIFFAGLFFLATIIIFFLAVREFKLENKIKKEILPETALSFFLNCFVIVLLQTAFFFFVSAIKYYFLIKLYL